MRFNLDRVDGGLLALAVLLVLYYVSGAGSGFPLDDSWIHQTYARNLARTGQWAFVPGEPSAASTSPLYTVLLAIGYWLHVPFPVWTHGLGALVLGLTGMLARRLAAQVVPGSRLIGPAAGVAVIGAWHLIWAAASGMETALFNMWTLALLWLGWHMAQSEPHTRSLTVRGIVFGAVAGLATLTRPEGFLAAVLVAVAAALAMPSRRWLQLGLSAAAAFLLVLAPYLMVNLSVTGGILPNTAAAKQAEYAPLLAWPYVTRVLNLFLPLAAGAQTLLLPGAIYYLVIVSRRYSFRRVLLYALPLVWPLALIGLYAARLPAWYQHGRYVMPALPSFITVGVVGTLWLLQRWRRPAPARVATRTLALAASITAVAFALIMGRTIYEQDVEIIDEAMVTTARWLAEHVDPGDLLAVHDIGAVGYFAPRPILDLAGLVSPEVVPLIHNGEALWSLMEAREVEYLMAFPDQIPGGDPDNPHLCSLFSSGGEPSMTVYAVAWDERCIKN